MNSESLKKAYQHGYEARQDGKARVSSYQQPAWVQEWYNGWDSADVYIKSGKGVTTNRAEAEGRYAYHAGKANVAPAHWSTKLRRAWHFGWEAADRCDRRKREASNSSWCAPAPPWEQSPFAKAREDLLKLGIEVPKFMERQRYNLPCRVLLHKQNINEEYGKLGNFKVYTGLTSMPLNKELNAMNSTLAFVFASLLPDVVSVKIVFPNYHQPYTYKALKSQGIAAGDFVIVDSPNGGPIMVKVTAVGTFEDLDAGAYQGYKWIVGKVDIADYTATTEKEKAFYEKVADLQRKAKAQKALAELAETLGGMDVLKSLIGDLTPAPVAVEDKVEDAGTPPAAE